MPNYLPVAAKTAGKTVALPGTTLYFAPCGDMEDVTAEASSQLIARDSYTLKNLYVRVTANSLDGATTIRSKVNSVNGNQSVSIGAGATGVFEDAVNTDNLVNGDLFCTEVVYGGTGGSITHTIFSYILSTASNTTPILATTCCYGSVNGTQYAPIIGSLAALTSTETRSQYRFRVAATLSNLRTYVSFNTVAVTSTVRTRKNTANGAQSVSIPGTATGAFEDALNTDIIASGDNVNFQAIQGGAGTLALTLIQLKSNSAGEQIGAASVSLASLGDGLTRYVAIGGISQSFTATEANVQVSARTPFTAKNMYVLIGSNSINGATTFRMRKNGGNGNMSVSVPAATTGQFEDTVNTDGFVAANLLNWQIITGGTSGTMVINCIGFELEQPTAPPPGAAIGGSMAAKMIAGKLI